MLDLDRKWLLSSLYEEAGRGRDVVHVGGTSLCYIVFYYVKNV